MRRNIERTFAIVLGVSLGFTGCATTGRPVTQLTPLQIRSIQTRDYDGKDRKVLIQAVMGQLQDDGYIIKEANADLGFLTARKEVDLRELKESRHASAGKTALGVAAVLAVAAGVAVAVASTSKHRSGDAEPYRPTSTSSENSPPPDRIQATECTVTVTPNGNQMRLRINFQQEVRNENGGVTQTVAIHDEKVYQTFFAKVDASLFIERETVSVTTSVANN